MLNHKAKVILTSAFFLASLAFGQNVHAFGGLATGTGGGGNSNPGGGGGIDPKGDWDKDGRRNDSDNCITAANPNQENRDGDALGDKCDACPYVKSATKYGSVTFNQGTNTDGDKFPDACDANDLKDNGEADRDSDGDGNPDMYKVDYDGDGIPDDGNDDSDGDGAVNEDEIEECRLNPNKMCGNLIEVLKSNTPICGNGVLEGSEKCEDGNTKNGDGCSSTCQAELVLANPKYPVCGDGLLEGTEKCEDGNKLNGDGCSSTCQVEVSSCQPAPQTPPADPQYPPQDIDPSRYEGTLTSLIHQFLTDIETINKQYANLGAARLLAAQDARISQLVKDILAMF